MLQDSSSAMGKERRDYQHLRQVIDLELWVTERDTEHAKVQWRINDILYRGRSRYQEIVVADSAEFGRILFLDGVIQVAVRDEFIYHEMLVHVPLTIHPKPEKVLIIGGGDGGALREVLKHPEVKRVHLVEIDEQVIEVSRKYLPELAGHFDDPRVEVRIADGIEYIKECRQAYDVILMDSSDPMGPAEGLFTEAFYGDAAKALKREGLIVVQSGPVFFNPQLIQDIQRALSRHFPWVRLYLANVPTFSSGPWAFTLACRHYLESVGPRRTKPALPTRYYSPEVHKAAFVLPRYIEELLPVDESSKDASTA